MSSSSEIDRLCTDLYGDHTLSWLAHPNDAPVFGGRSPLAHMVQRRNGVADTLHHLEQQAFRASLDAIVDAPSAQARMTRSGGTGARRKL